MGKYEVSSFMSFKISKIGIWYVASICQVLALQTISKSEPPL